MIYSLQDHACELDGVYTNPIQKIKAFYQNITQSNNVGEHNVNVVDMIIHNNAWHELLHICYELFIEADINLDFDEMAHTLRFVFLNVEPNQILEPHTDSNVRHTTTMLIPLHGKCKIDFYNHDGSNPIYKSSLVYKNPLILNVNNWHGVVNDTNEKRVVLKIVFPLTQYHDLIRSIGANEPVKMFNFDMPWVSDSPKTRQRFKPYSDLYKQHKNLDPSKTS